MRLAQSGIWSAVARVLPVALPINLNLATVTAPLWAYALAEHPHPEVICRRRLNPRLSSAPAPRWIFTPQRRPEPRTPSTVFPEQQGRLRRLRFLTPSPPM